MDPEKGKCTERLCEKEAVGGLLNSSIVRVTQQTQYFRHRHLNKSCSIKLNRQSVYLHTIHANAVRHGVLCNTVYRTCIVRGEKRNDACVRHIGRTASVVAEVAESDQCLLATPPAPNQAGVPPNPRNDALHPSRRRVASLFPTLIPLFSSSKPGWDGGRSLNNFIYDIGYCTEPAGGFQNRRQC